MGQPAVFVRLSGCNLKCDFCDSRYADTGIIMSVFDVEKEIKSYGCEKVIITGGEPLLQTEEVKKLFYLLVDSHIISLETNGTIYTDLPFRLISVSPKRQHLNMPILGHYAKQNNIIFKFVKEEGIVNWWEPLIAKLQIPAKKVWIMPEGKTRKKQLQKMEDVWEYCSDRGFNFSPRLHVLTYDDKRGV